MWNSPRTRRTTPARPALRRPKHQTTSGIWHQASQPPAQDAMRHLRAAQDSGDAPECAQCATLWTCATEFWCSVATVKDTRHPAENFQAGRWHATLQSRSRHLFPDLFVLQDANPRVNQLYRFRRPAARSSHAMLLRDQDAQTPPKKAATCARYIPASVYIHLMMSCEWDAMQSVLSDSECHYRQDCATGFLQQPRPCRYTPDQSPRLHAGSE